jgi:hypothetical protein
MRRRFPVPGRSGRPGFPGRRFGAPSLGADSSARSCRKKSEEIPRPQRAGFATAPRQIDLLISFSGTGPAAARWLRYLLLVSSGGHSFPQESISEERHAKVLIGFFLQSRPSLWNPILRNLHRCAFALMITVREPGLRPCPRNRDVYGKSRRGQAPALRKISETTHHSVGADSISARGDTRILHWPVGTVLTVPQKRTGLRRAGQDPPLRRRELRGGYYPPLRSIESGQSRSVI